MAQVIFEAVNRTLREVLVGASGAPLEAVRERHAKTRPPELASWDFAAHEIVYREVERGVPERDVPAFLDGYARSIRRAGWIMRTASDGWIVAPERKASP